MRYSIKKVTAAQVAQAGGSNIKETRVAIFADLTPQQAERLRALGAALEPVSKVQSTVIMAPAPAPPLPVAGAPTWSSAALIYATGINQIREMTHPQLYGEGFNVAVIGTGIRDTHEQLAGRVVYKKNYTSDPHADAFDHETGVAAIIVTVAPSVNILDMKVLDSKGQGTSELVVLAIDDLISMKEEGSEYAPHVINLSLGTDDTGDPDDPLRAICREAVSRGIFVIASAGNGGPLTSVMSPACERYVFAVGSIDPIARDGQITDFIISDFSSRGPTREGLVKPDGVFFGRDIELASSASDTALTAKSGTSFACPFISGAAVLFLEGWLATFTNWQQYVEEFMPQVPPSEYVSVLPSEKDILDTYLRYITVKPSGAPQDKDNEYGWGLPYGPLLLERLSFHPMAAVAGITEAVIPLMGIGLIGMMMGSMTKALR